MERMSRIKQQGNLGFGVFWLLSGFQSGPLDDIASLGEDTLKWEMRGEPRGRQGPRGFRASCACSAGSMGPAQPGALRSPHLPVSFSGLWEGNLNCGPLIHLLWIHQVGVWQESLGVSERIFFVVLFLWNRKSVFAKNKMKNWIWGWIRAQEEMKIVSFVLPCL